MHYYYLPKDLLLVQKVAIDIFVTSRIPNRLTLVLTASTEATISEVFERAAITNKTISHHHHAPL